MRSTIEHCVARYVGHIAHEPWIAVDTEETESEVCEVFHAMVLTKSVAEKVFELTAGDLDLRGVLVGHRAHIGPQEKPVTWPLDSGKRIP